MKRFFILCVRFEPLVFNMNFLYTNNQVITSITFGYKIHIKTRAIIGFNSQMHCFQKCLTKNLKICGIDEDLN